jgi:hypothetical protein
MTDEQSNASQGGEANHIADEVATLSITSPPIANGSKESADSDFPSAQETGNPASVQSPPCRPLWDTQEGRITGYRRMIQENLHPENRANFEALIRYYKEGGKIPEGDEEVWAVDGEASFGIRDYIRNRDQRPEGWLSKLRYCDVSSFCLCLGQGFSESLVHHLVTNSSITVSLLDLEVLSNPPGSWAQ